jgi:hypothetical protein
MARLMSGIDWGIVGGAITSVGIGIGGVYAWWLKTSRDRANTRAEVAKSESNVAVATASETVYTMLTERVVTLENDMRLVRQELAEERQHSRRLVLHIWKLEQLMRAAGLEVPAFVDGEVGAIVGKS